MHYWQQQPSEMAVVGPKMPAKLSSSQPYKHASGKDWDSQCSWCLLSSYGNNIPGSNGNHATHTASQQHMKNRQVAEMLTVYTQVQMVICSNGNLKKSIRQCKLRYTCSYRCTSILIPTHFRHLLYRKILDNTKGLGKYRNGSYTPQAVFNHL